MKLLVYTNGSRRGVSYYVINPADKERDKPIPGEVIDRLTQLMPRIEKMARKQLGEYFVSLILSGGDLLVLNVKRDTSTVKKYEFQDLCGWISLCDEETDDPLYVRRPLW